MSRRRAALAAAAALLFAACRGPAPAVDHERIVTDSARGVRFVVPPGWREQDAEIRSPAGSLLTLRVFDLVEADKKFVAGLPDTLLPQLKDWAQLYYIVEGEPTRKATTVDGVAATEFVYPTRVRKTDPPSKVVYWVVVHKTRLFVLRAAFPADALATDEPVLRTIVGRWSFVDPAG